MELKYRDKQLAKIVLLSFATILQVIDFEKYTDEQKAIVGAILFIGLFILLQKRKMRNTLYWIGKDYSGLLHVANNC